MASGRGLGTFNVTFKCYYVTTKRDTISHHFLLSHEMKNLGTIYHMPVIKQFTNSALFSHPKYRETLLFTQNLGLARQNKLGITAKIT